MPFRFRCPLLIACILLAGIVPSVAQTNTPSTNAPSATTPSPAIALGEIVSQAQADTLKLQADQAELSTDPTLASVNEKLPEITLQIDNQIKADAHLFAGTVTLNNLQPAQTAWRSLADKLDTAQKDLFARVQILNAALFDRGQLNTKWKATLDAATQSKAPPDLLQRVKQVLSLIDSSTKAVQASLTPIYSMQNSVSAQETRTTTGLDAIDRAIEKARLDLFKKNQPALWETESLSPAEGSMVVQERTSFAVQLSEFKAYVHTMIGAILVHLVILALLIAGLHWIRNAIRARLKDQPALQEAAIIFEVPMATALLLALLAGSFLYPDAPRLLRAALGATALLPAVIVTRRLIDPENFSILYATLIAYLVDQVRYVATPEGVLARFLLVVELTALCIFLLTALRSEHLATSSLESGRLKRFTRFYLHLAFFVFLFAAVANVFGYAHLSGHIGEGMLDASYLAVVLYAAVRILDALAISAMNIRPFSSLGMVRRHQDLIFANVTTAIRWLIFGLWLLVSLQKFALLDPAWQEIVAIRDTQIPWFSLGISIGALFAFPITIWASFLVSRFIRFVLEEEVYPHLQLGRGIPYAASTMVNYVVLIIGFFAAVAATGAPLSQFAFLAGAFGVGLGLGLQNIFNNFVSGIILLFERPIKVGDDVQIGTDMGRVERIGIRASVILLANGSELIVPNGNLISNPVTNWTLSNCERLIEIPVTITSKVDPAHVQTLLTAVVAAHANVLKNPPPHTLLVTFGAALNFKVRAWIDSEDEWMKITSDLSIAINSALTKEGITVG